MTIGTCDQCYGEVVRGEDGTVHCTRCGSGPALPLIKMAPRTIPLEIPLPLVVPLVIPTVPTTDPYPFVEPQPSIPAPWPWSDAPWAPRIFC